MRRRSRAPRGSARRGSSTGASWSSQPRFGRMIQRAIRTRSSSSRSTRSSSRSSPERPALTPCAPIAGLAAPSRAQRARSRPCSAAELSRPGRSRSGEHRRVLQELARLPGGQPEAAGHLLEAHLAAVLVRAGGGERRLATLRAPLIGLAGPLRARRPHRRRTAAAARRLRFGSSTVPFEQIGQSATKRLWRQNWDTRHPNLDARLCHMRPMRTAVVSDLHLGAPGRRRRARARASALRALTEAVADADRLVLLGRHRRAARAPARRGARGAPARVRGARPRAGRPAGRCSCRGTTTTRSREPWLAGLRLAGHALAPETEWPVEPATTAPVGAHREWMPRRGADARLPRPAPARRRLRHPRPLPRPAPDHPAARVDRGVRDGAAHGPRPGAALGRGLRGRSWRRSTPSTPGSPQGASAAALSRGGSVSRDGLATRAATHGDGHRDARRASCSAGSRSRARWPP